jgi:hypothetical protein
MVRSLYLICYTCLMKTFLTLLLLCPLWVFAQSAEPFKKANTIEVHTALTPAQAYKALANVLQDNGYSIVSSDATLGTISTDKKAFKNITTKLNTSVRGDSTAIVIIKGLFDVRDNDYTPIEHRGANNSPYMRAWEQMASIAQALQGELRYR